MQTHTWTCDTCGHTIEKIEDGWVEWWIPAKKESGLGKGLRLVHNRSTCPYGPEGSCQYDEKSEMSDGGFCLQDHHLEKFLGDDGLMWLLSLLAEGDLPKEDVLEMIKRLHITGYEHTRFHFDRAIKEAVIEPMTPPRYYCQDEINTVLKFIAQPQNGES